jgi:hypothetical protein
MVSQLSTSDRFAQPARVAFFGVAFGPAQRAFMVTLLLLWPILVQAQGSSLEVSVEPLTAIDQQFMEDQRARVEQLANRIGRGLTGNTDRDLGTLQRILDERMVPPTDTLTLQAMGAVFGDLLGDRLDMSWVVYRDGRGRSRALRYRSKDIYLFPMTMISRRQEGGSDRRLKPLFDQIASETRRLIPGGKWFE